ncbi:VirB4 family type IV secretion/conjugal transfer ATPase [Wohlfahrtiimonas populi]|uniref:VirB4 family type IV secretion/conjugal transfer ATPase n=1 Tax=Wohlfahrtiimonas populi TaxID=1940240 RepID=UPI00098D6C08|nr:VirB4 family type IV secretion/conjugal transfer ATPase [Wohlfahrtiimonas populi]
MRKKTTYEDHFRAERDISSYIPYSAHVSPTVITTIDNDYLQVWKLAGISFETADDELLDVRKEQLNTILRSLGSENFAIWTHNVRRRTSDRLEAEFSNEFCRDFDKKYYDSFTGYRMMANELYLTLVYRPITSATQRAAAKSARRTTADIRLDLEAALEKMKEASYQIEASFSRYDITPLTSYEENGVLYSEILTFLNFLVTTEWQKVRVPKIPLNQYLGNAWLFAGTETIELRTPTRTRYLQGIDFKDYTSHTEAGLLNALMYEDYEYIMTQSFSFMSRPQGKKFLETQQRQLSNSGDGSVTQIEEMALAIDQLIQGQFAMGEYHFSLYLIGDTVESVVENRTSAMAIVQDLGFIAAQINTATEAGFYAQMPANWFYRPRIARLTSINFAGLCSFHNFSAGKRDGNPWGQAVTLFKTPSGQPLYFNFHSSREEDNDFDKKLLGNTRIIGQSGAGKTVLLATLLCQVQKYNRGSNSFTTVLFDKDQGAMIAVRALGGKYLALKHGQPTGLNPFQMDPTDENIIFLEQFVKQLVSTEGSTITVTDEQKISAAVRTVMRMPKHVRCLSLVTQNITEGIDKEDRENSVVKRLSKWLRGGTYGWVFDESDDQIDFTTHSNYGIDGTAFLDEKTVCTPISMYLLHRMEQVIDGRRFIYFMDEFWKWLDDEAFSDFARNKQYTIRKQNGLGVFATQSPSQILGSDISKAIIEQCATEIYLPNPLADKKDYMEGFKLSETEFNIIRKFNEDSRMFLIKQGHRTAIGKLDLKGFDDELAILSGSTDNVEIVESIIDEVGEDPKVWLPIFHERRKNFTNN